MELEQRLIRHILEPFGPLVQSAGISVYNQNVTLQQIKLDTGLKAAQVRQALIVLIHHNLVEFHEAKYKFDLINAFYRLLFPHFVFRCIQMLGQLAGDILLNVLQNGRMNLEDFDKECREVVDLLLEKKFLKVVSDKEHDSPKKVKTEAKQVCQGNFEKLFIIVRDNLITNYTKRKHGESGSELVKTILNANANSPLWYDNTVTYPISIVQIRQEFPKEVKLLVEYDEKTVRKDEISEYLHSLCNGFVRKADQHKYQIDLSKAREDICLEYIRQSIVGKLGSLSMRVFNILLKESFLEEKQVAKKSMIGVKEVRAVLFSLFKNKFIQLQQVPKSADHAPNRSIFLWTVDINQTKSSFIDFLKKSLVNLSDRIKFEKENDSLAYERMSVSEENLTKNELSLVQNLRLRLERLEYEYLRLIEFWSVFIPVRK